MLNQLHQKLGKCKLKATRTEHFTKYDRQRGNLTVASIGEDMDQPFKLLLAFLKLFYINPQRAILGIFFLILTPSILIPQIYIYSIHTC